MICIINIYISFQFKETVIISVNKYFSFKKTNFFRKKENYIKIIKY